MIIEILIITTIAGLMLSVAIISPEMYIRIYKKFKVDANYIGGLFASLGISTLANKIDYILYWDMAKMSEWKLSMLFGIVCIMIGLRLFDLKSK